MECRVELGGWDGIRVWVLRGTGRGSSGLGSTVEVGAAVGMEMAVNDAHRVRDGAGGAHRVRDGAGCGTEVGVGGDCECGGQSGRVAHLRW